MSRSLWVAYYNMLEELNSTALEHVSVVRDVISDGAKVIICEKTHIPCQEQLSSSFGLQITEPLSGVLKTLESQRKQLVSEGQRHNKVLQEAYTSLKRVRCLFCCED